MNPYIHGLNWMDFASTLKLIAKLRLHYSRIIFLKCYIPLWSYLERGSPTHERPHFWESVAVYLLFQVLYTIGALQPGKTYLAKILFNLPSLHIQNKIKWLLLYNLVVIFRSWYQLVDIIDIMYCQPICYNNSIFMMMYVFTVVYISLLFRVYHKNFWHKTPEEARMRAKHVERYFSPNH